MPPLFLHAWLKRIRYAQLRYRTRRATGLFFDVAPPASKTHRAKR